MVIKPSTTIESLLNHNMNMYYAVNSAIVYLGFGYICIAGAVLIINKICLKDK